MNRSFIRRKKHTVVVAMATGLALWPVAILAQEKATPGLTFGLVLRVESDDNPDLDPVSSSTRNRASVGLSFGFLTETRTARLTLDGAVRVVSSNNTQGNGLLDPSLALSYSRSAANAALSFDASWRETDLGDAQAVDEFDTGTGTRINTAASLGMMWGNASPFGFGLNGGVSEVRYQDTSDTTLQGSQTKRLGASLRFDLSKASQLDLTLTGSRFDEDGAFDARDTLSFGAGLSFERPLGTTTIDLLVADTEDGTRTSLSVGQSYALAGGGQVQVSLGATRGVDGETRATGALAYTQDFGSAAVTATLARNVSSSGTDDTERVITSARLGYQQEISPLSSLNLNLDWAESLTTSDDNATTNASIGASYRRTLTEDWALDLGYRHRQRDEDGVGRSESNTVFLELRRDFAFWK